MAYVKGKSGSFEFADSYLTIQVNWSETYDISSNTSIVQIDSMKVKTNSASRYGTWCPCWIVKINGEEVGKSNYYSPSTHKVILGTKDTYENVVVNHSGGVAFPWKSSAIEHNADGSKAIVISVVPNPAGHSIKTIQLYRTSDGSIRMFGDNHSSTVSLTTIARASQPSLVTYPETTQNVGEFGEEFSIHMNTASQDFRHTVRYEYGDRSGTIATNVVNGTTWTVPLSFMNDIPSATSASGRIYVDTYSNGTLIGTKYTGFTVSVPASVKPSCTATLEDITGIDGIYGSPVQGLSKIKVTVTPTEAYSSSILSYSISIDRVKYSSQTATTGFLTNSGESVVTVTVRDRRGRTSDAWRYTMRVQEYNKPSITKLSVHRCDEDGNEDDQGKFVSVDFSAQVTPLKNLNVARYVLKYKKTSESDWTTVTLPYANVYEVTDENYRFEADVESSYNVELAVEDKHNTIADGKATTRSTSVSTAFTLMDWHSSGTGIRFGGVSEETNTFRNDLVFMQRGNSYACFSAVNAIEGFVRIAQITIIAANADSPIMFEVISRASVTPMVVHVKFQSVATTKAPLSSITYNGSNAQAYLTEISDGVWDLYIAKNSKYDVITVSRWYTAEIMAKKISVKFPLDHVSTVPPGLNGYYHATPAVLQSIIDCLLPVGMIIQLYSHADPNKMYPGTTWVRMANTFLWGTDSSGTIGQTGGEKTHTLTTNEMPKHSHGSVYSQHANGTKNKAWFNTSGSVVAYGEVETGGGAAHNNMPPYTQVSIWRRTA